MKTYYMYWVFSEYHPSGFQIMTEPDQIGIPKTWNFIKEVELPEIDIHAVKEAGAKVLDDEITDLRVKIEKINEKKKQLLALSHKGAE